MVSLELSTKMYIYQIIAKFVKMLNECSKHVEKHSNFNSFCDKIYIYSKRIYTIKSKIRINFLIFLQ
jgi:hypothetical protein